MRLRKLIKKLSDLERKYGNVQVVEPGRGRDNYTIITAHKFSVVTPKTKPKLYIRNDG